MCGAETASELNPQWHYWECFQLALTFWTSTLGGMGGGGRGLGANCGGTGMG